MGTGQIRIPPTWISEAVHCCKSVRLLCGESFEQVTDAATDTTIYAFTKLIHLLTSCNPNTVELLGLKPEHYLYVSDIGRVLLANRKMFLSKKAISSFGGYAAAQLRRLGNKSARLTKQAVQEKHILHNIESASETFRSMYFHYPDDAIRLYIDDAVHPKLDKEIFMDISLRHYPLRDYQAMWNRMADIVRDYSRVGQRNQNAISHNKLGKHMMHLVRLYMMCIDILEKGEIITYRAAERDLLMDIRNGKFLDDNRQPTEAFFALLEEYQARMAYVQENTDLPEEPAYAQIQDFVLDVQERVVMGRI